MVLVKRWYEPRRFSMTGPEQRLLPWRMSDDGRAYLVSKRTPQAYVARFAWAKWNRWVMQGFYYPLIRTLECACVLEIPDGVEHRLSDWKTFSLRESTIRTRHTSLARGARRTMLYDAIWAMEHPDERDTYRRWTTRWWEEMDLYQTANPALQRLLDEVRN